MWHMNETELLALLGRAIQAHHDLHRTYGNTTACWGGIGGQAMTFHCAVDCDNPVHAEAQETWREVEAAYFEETQS